MRKGPLLAEGRTAEIYAWGDDRVLKLFRPNWDREEAEYEHRKALASQETGFAVPQVYEVVEIEGRAGIIYQRLDGVTMLQALQKRLWLFPRFARQLAELHVEMHARTPEGLQSQHDRLRVKIERGRGLKAEVKNRVLERVERLQQGDRLLHGDFHPDNVMLTDEGSYIIDWIDASCGHPLADVARTVVLSTMSHLPPEVPARRIIMLIRTLFNRIYLRNYFKRSRYSRADLEAWILPVMAGRLSENIPEEVDPMVARIERSLENR